MLSDAETSTLRAFLGVYGVVSEADVALWSAALESGGCQEGELSGALAEWAGASGKKPLPIEIVRLARARRDSASLRSIMRRVALSHGVSEDDLRSESRVAGLVDARADAARQMRAEGASLNLIGRVLRRDHSTVRSLLRRGSLVSVRSNGGDR